MRRFQGGQLTKHVCVYINNKSQVMIELKSKHVGKEFSKKIKCVFYGVFKTNNQLGLKVKIGNIQKMFTMSFGVQVQDQDSRTKMRWVDRVQTFSVFYAHI